MCTPNIPNTTGSKLITVNNKIIRYDEMSVEGQKKFDICMTLLASPILTDEQKTSMVSNTVLEIETLTLN